MACNRIFTVGPQQRVCVRAESSAALTGEQQIVDCNRNLIEEKTFDQEQLEEGVCWTTEPDRIYRLFVLRSPSSSEVVVTHEFLGRDPIVDHCSGGINPTGPWSVNTCFDQGESLV